MVSFVKVNVRFFTCDLGAEKEFEASRREFEASRREFKASVVRESPSNESFLCFFFCDRLLPRVSVHPRLVERDTWRVSLACVSVDARSVPPRCDVHAVSMRGPCRLDATGVFAKSEMNRVEDVDLMDWSTDRKRPVKRSISSLILPAFLRKNAKFRVYSTFLWRR